MIILIDRGTKNSQKYCIYTHTHQSVNYSFSFNIFVLYKQAIYIYIYDFKNQTGKENIKQIIQFKYIKCTHFGRKTMLFILDWPIIYWYTNWKIQLIYPDLKLWTKLRILIYLFLILFLSHHFPTRCYHFPYLSLYLYLLISLPSPHTNSSIHQLNVICYLSIYCFPYPAVPSHIPICFFSWLFSFPCLSLLRPPVEVHLAPHHFQNPSSTDSSTARFDVVI